MQTSGAIRAGKAYVEVGANSDSLSAGLRAAQARLAAFGSAVRNVGAGMMGLGLGILTPFAGAAKTFMDFESEMARVKSILQPTTGEFKALNDEALRIGRDTVFSSSEAARAMVYFAQAGFSVKEMLQSVGPAMKLAAANSISLEQATGAAITVLRGMGLSAADLERSLNVLGAAANASYTDVTLLASGFAYVAADARSTGMDLASVAAALAVFSDEGIRGERAGTTLRAILADFKNLTPQAAAELKRLGVTLTDAKGNWRPIADIFSDLGAKLNGLGGYARDASLAKIFDTRSGSGATILMQNLEKYVRLSKQIRDVGDLNSRMEAEQLDTLRGSWKLLTSSVEGFSLEVGKNLASVLRDVGAVLVPVANAAAKWAKENPELFQTILKVAAGVTVAGAAMMGMGIIIGSITPLLGMITAGLGAIGTAALLLWKPALILGAIGTAVYALVQYSDTARSAWQGLASWGAGVMSAIGRGVLTTFNQMADSAKLAMTGVWDAIQGGDLEGAFQIAGLGIKAVWEDLWANVKAGAMNALAYVGSGFVSVFLRAGEAVEKIFVSLFQFLGDTWDRTWGAIQGTYDHNAIQRSREAIIQNAEWAARRKEEISNKYGGMRDILNSDYQAEMDARNKNAAEASAGTRARIAELNAAAKRKRELAEFEATMKDMGPKMPSDMGSRIKALGEGGLVGKAEVSGTFNAAMAGLVGASSVTQQIAESSKRSADGIDKLVRQGGQQGAYA